MARMMSCSDGLWEGVRVRRVWSVVSTELRKLAVSFVEKSCSRAARGWVEMSRWVKKGR